MIILRQKKLCSENILVQNNCVKSGMQYLESPWIRTMPGQVIKCHVYMRLQFKIQLLYKYTVFVSIDHSEVTKNLVKVFN